MNRISFILTVSLAAVVIMPRSVFALTVSPPRIEITGDAGRTVTGTYILINEEADTRTFYSSFANFEASGESGVPKFVDTKTGLATWLNTSSTVTLKPREEREIPFSITIPEGTESGGYFAAIFWGTSAPVSKNAVSIGGKVGILMLLRVSGAVDGKSGLLDFATQDNQRIFSALPVNFIWRFRNDGGNRIQPGGVITVKNIFGMTAATFPANSALGGVLPTSTRKFSVPWVPGVTNLATNTTRNNFLGALHAQWTDLRFGWYTAQLSLKYDDSEESSTASRFSFWIIPWQLLSVIVVSIVTVGLCGRVGLKRYNRWIILKAGHIEKK